MTRCSQCGLRLGAHEVCPRDGAPGWRLAIETDDAESRAPEPVRGRTEAALVRAGFVLEAELGRGGFGAVYVARRPADAQPIALKVAHTTVPKALQSLYNEALVLETLQGEHAPRLLSKGLADDGSAYLAMVRVEAQTLADRMVQSRGVIPMRTFRSILHGLLRALRPLHDRGLVHRDLKPENILVAEKAEVTLIDFGLTTPLSRGVRGGAREFVLNSAAPSERSHGSQDAGTVEYMSPEQCHGWPVDLRSDVYALGSLMYELLSGAPPFWGEPAEVREAHRFQRPVPLSTKVNCPAQLEELVHRCLAKDPDARFDGLDSLALALKQACDTIGESFRPSPLKPAAHASRAATSEHGARTVVLAYLIAGAGQRQLVDQVRRFGGLLIEVQGDVCVVMFGHDAGRKPMGAAVAAARQLLESSITAGVTLDIAQVTLQPRRAGGFRVFGAAVKRTDLARLAEGSGGLLLSQAAADLLPTHSLVPVENVTGLFRLVDFGPLAPPSESTESFIPSVGREGLVAELQHSVVDALQAGPCLTTILGAHGMGKSHLLQDLSLHLARREPSLRVLRFSANVSEASTLSGVLLRAVLALPDEAPADFGRAVLEQALGQVGREVWAAAALHLGWVDANHPEVQRLRAAPRALHIAAARALGEALRSAARRTPLALLVDDAHAADDVSLDAIEHASRGSEGARLWVGVFAHPALLKARKAWGVRATRHARHTLEALGEEASETLLRALLEPVVSVSKEALQLLHARSQGVPGQMVELVRGLRREGAVRPLPRGQGFYLATEELEHVPAMPLAEWNTLRVLDRMSPLERRTLELCAVLGREVDEALLDAAQRRLEREGVPGEAWLEPAVGIRRLHSARWLRVSKGCVCFANALVADVVYQKVAAPLRERMHRAALEACRASAAPESVRLWGLARHAHGCGERAQTAEAYFALGERAAVRHDYLAAERAFVRCLEALAERNTPRFVEAARGLGVVRMHLARYVEAAEILSEARAVADRLMDEETRAHLLLDEAMVRDWLWELERSAALVEQAAQLTARDSPLLEARLCLGLARSHGRAGREAQSISLAQRAADLAAPLGDAGYQTRVVALLWMAFSADRPIEAEAAAEEAIALSRARGDSLHLAATYSNRGFGRLDRADAIGALADFEAALHVAREAGSMLAELEAHSAMTEVHLALGDYEKADAALAARRPFAEALAGIWHRRFLLDQARLALLRGLADQARALCLGLRAALDSHDGEELTLDEAELALLEALELRAGDAQESAWSTFVDRLKPEVVVASQRAEILEHHALAAAERGQRELAHARLHDLLHYCKEHSCLALGRIARRLEGLE